MLRLAAAFLALLAHAFAHAAEPSIAASFAHVLVAKSDGAVSGWGSDQFGKLATGRAIIRTSPGKIQGLPSIVQVASTTFGFHFVARDANGRVWTWGQNDFGQLGPRVQRDASIPGRVQSLSDVTQVAATGSLSIALRADGTVWYWGTWYSGAFAVPTKVDGLAGIVQIAGSETHFFARRSDGTVWAMGGNWQNQLGIGAPSQFAPPTKVPLPPDVVEVTATIRGGAARTADGKVWSWGASDFAGLGDASPREVTGFPQKPTRVTGESLRYMAILPDGTLWSWGNTTAPAKMQGFANVKAVGSATGDLAHSDVMAVDTLGRMFVRSGNGYGEGGLGHSTPTDDAAVTQVPSPTNFVDVRFTSYCVMAITGDGGVWTWGAEVNGSFGTGAIQSYPVPRPIPGLPSVKQVVAGVHISAALDNAGNVWAWGDSPGNIGGRGSPSSVPVQVPISGVKAIALGWSHVLMLKTDGTVWLTGGFLYAGHPTPTQVTGLPVIASIAAGLDVSFAIALDGRLFAWGENSKGEVGAGDTIPRLTPVEVTVPGGATLVVANQKSILARSTTGDVYGWGDVDARNTLGVPSSPGSIVTTPQKVAGISGVVELAAGIYHYLARKADGTLLSWGIAVPAPLGRDIGAATPAHVPSPVLEIDSVATIAAANNTSFAIRTDGSVWGWGEGWTSGLGPPVGDGTFVRRARPVVVIRENGAGNLDTNDWFLDSKPGTQKTIPAAKRPKVVSTARSLSSSGTLNVDGGVNVRLADQGKSLGLFVTGLVPVEFFTQPGMAPGAQAKVAGLKAGTLVLVNLTPSGWTVASGQLSAFTSGTGNAFLGAAGLLTNVNPASIPGARFCIGYGESATDMITTGTIRDFLSLEGASTTLLDSQCLVSGVYVDGPRTSPQGSAIPVRAVVVGQSPTGTVRFKAGFSDISANVPVNSVNAAVSDASISYTHPAAGEVAFGAVYGGDGVNAGASSEVPLRHVVQPVLANTTTRLEAPVTSEIGMEVPLVATVTGNRPGGAVQFKRGAANEGSPVAVVNDQAMLTVIGLGLGPQSFTAHYSGDGSNQPSASAAISHTVLDVATSRATLAASANPSVLGDAVTLTATVTGINPAGSVTLRERANVIESKSLSGGSASFTLTGLTPGVHVYLVDYSGDAGNPATTSNAVFQQVTLNIPPGGDLDGDGIINSVELTEGTDPSRKDNDIFTSARLFAMQQYRDFLGREGDAGGVSHWTTQLSSGAQTRAQMAETFFTSAEFQGTGAPVARLYFAYFRRIPDYGGLNFWIGQFRGGNGLESISNAFAGSPEFVNTYGALSTSQFVNLVYQNVLGRPPDAPGLAYWTGQINGGMTRGRMMLEFSESAEYRALIGNEIYVTMMYIGMLRRAPDTGGFSYWVGYMDAGNSGLALTGAFVAAPEYRSRFLP